MVRPKFLVIALATAPLLDAAPVSLFDGKSLAGREICKVGDGMIIGGSLSEQVPYNTLIASTKNYENFDLS